MSENTKELKRKLLTTFWVGDGEESDTPGDAVDVIEALEAEVERLKGVLEFIASTIGSFEGRGSYTAYVEMTGGLMDEANKALEAKP